MQVDKHTRLAISIQGTDLKHGCSVLILSLPGTCHANTINDAAGYAKGPIQTSVRYVFAPNAMAKERNASLALGTYRGFELRSVKAKKRNLISGSFPVGHRWL